MNKDNRVIAFSFKERIDLDKVQEIMRSRDLIKSEPSFLLYKLNHDSYIYIKDYGSIVHFNINNKLSNEINSKICKVLRVELNDFTESLYLNTNEANNISLNFDELRLKNITKDIAQIICLNLAQSTALFYFNHVSETLLKDTRKHTNELERNGRLSLNRNKLLKYIGSTLNLKNKISENLFIFNTPQLAWEDKTINHLDNILNEHLEIRYRYNAIKEQLNTVKENLELFKDMILHKHSSFLEWIIILLILFEVIHVIIEKIVH